MNILTYDKYNKIIQEQLNNYKKQIDEFKNTYSDFHTIKKKDNNKLLYK